MLYYDGNTRGNHIRERAAEVVAKEDYVESIKKATIERLDKAGAFELSVIRKYLTELDQKEHSAACIRRRKTNGFTKADH